MSGPGSLFPDLEPAPAPKARVLFDLIADVCGWSSTTDARRGWINGAIPKILPLWNGDPEQVRAKARAYHAKHGLVALTPSALAKWWPTLPELREGWSPDPRRLLPDDVTGVGESAGRVVGEIG